MINEALQPLGREIAQTCLGAIKTLETHGPENQALYSALDRLVALIETGLALTGGAVVRLDVVDGRLLLNGERLRAHGTTQEQFDQLVSQMAIRRVGGVAFSTPQTQISLRRWFTVLSRRPPDEAAFATLHAELAQLALTGVHALELRTVVTPDREAIVAVSTMAYAMQTYARALLGFRDFVKASSEQKDPYKNRIDVVKVVQDLVDVVAARADLLFQIISLAVTRPIGRGYAEIHAANTCAYALMMGHVLELDRTALLDLGTSALLAEVTTVLRHDPALDEPLEWTSERRALQRSDLTRSVRGMLELGDLDDALMIRAIVAEEHGAEDSASTHLYSRITAVAGAYDALTQRRPWREALAPADAVRTLAEGPRFDRHAVVALECVLAGYIGVGT